MTLARPPESQPSRFPPRPADAALPSPKQSPGFAQAGEEIFYRALEAGLSSKVTMGNVLTLTPPLTITEAELDEALGILEGYIGEVG